MENLRSFVKRSVFPYDAIRNVPAVIAVWPVAASSAIIRTNKAELP